MSRTAAPQTRRLLSGVTLVMAAIVLLTALGRWGTPFVDARQARVAFVPTPCPEQEWRYADPAFEPLAGARAFSGRYEGGLYRIEMPDNWNGELVLYAHGFTTNMGPMGDLLRVGNVPFIREHIIGLGYAWAASSYRCNGYVPGVGLQDTMLLPDLVMREAGVRPPSRTFLMGPSMGGHVTVLGLHQFPTAFDAGLALCPAGPELFDFFMATGAAAEVVTGERFTDVAGVAATTARILGITGLPGEYTEAGRQLASIQINISGGPRPFAEQGLGLDGVRFAANISGAALAGSTALLSRAATNEHIDYGIGAGLSLTSEQLNAVVRRQPADPAIRGPEGPYNELKPFDGRIERPLLTLHTTGDLFVPFFLQQVLKRAVDAAGRSDLLVQRIIRSPGHCTFSAAEAIQGFDDMIRWVREGERPEGDDVFGDLRDAGRRFTNPLRSGDPGGVDIEPVVTIPPLPEPVMPEPPVAAPPPPSKGG